MNHSSMDSRCYISEHLLFDILLWLPVTSLLRFKSVCKSWYTLIDSPVFISQHLNHNNVGNDSLLGIHFDTASVPCLKFCLLSGKKYEVYDKFDCGQPMHDVAATEMAFSSNGILCLVRDDKNISLWNPATRQLRSLVIPSRFVSFFGFGFNVKSNDHTIVRTTFCFENTSKNLVEVYSLRAGSWRTMRKYFAMPSRFYRSDNYHITKDGTCFWIAYSELVTDDTDGNVILSFDLNEETYETMPLPVGVVPPSAVIDFLGDKLTYIHDVDHRSCINDHSYYEIWILHEYGVKESWNKAWKIGPTDDLLFPSRFICNGEFLLLSNNMFRKNSRSFRLYNIDTEEIELCQPDLCFLWSIGYTESLFPVKRGNGDAH